MTLEQFLPCGQRAEGASCPGWTCPQGPGGGLSGISLPQTCSSTSAP